MSRSQGQGVKTVLHELSPDNGLLDRSSPELFGSARTMTDLAVDLGLLGALGVGARVALMGLLVQIKYLFLEGSLENKQAV